MFVVTGATSNTGRAVAAALLDAGARVRVIGRDPGRLAPFVSRGAEPFVAEPSDSAAMRRAFEGAIGAYVMLQPGYIADSPDFPAYQQASIDAIAPALASSDVEHAVALSGWGANYDRASGPLDGLRRLEARLAEIPHLNVLSLRPGWFMENAVPLIQSIRQSGHAASQIRGDLALPMIATMDVGKVAADALLARSFSGQGLREIQGPGELTLAAAATIIGDIVGKPDAIYAQETPGNAKLWLLAAGFSEHMAQAFVDMSEDLNARRIRMLLPIEERIITPTSFAQFVSSFVASKDNG